jgi:molybdopterin-guanine dinucleotide biosynthesis protein A
MGLSALLLTGGASRRMGRDKASLPSLAGLDEGGARPGETLAERTARLLALVADPVLELGPGRSGAPALDDPVPFAGPLAALAAGAAALREGGHLGPVLVLATDLPLLSPGMLRWLAGHPSPWAVVPLDAGGREQPLCARYPLADLERAASLVVAGERRLGALLELIVAERPPAAAWAGPAGRPDALDDADRPEDLEAARLAAASPGPAIPRPAGPRGPHAAGARPTPRAVPASLRGARP